MSFTADSSLLLVSTLDSTHRLLDLKHGTVVQSFTGHKNTSYRSQSCFGAREETVICGDEEGQVFGWDMEAVSALSPGLGWPMSGRNFATIMDGGAAAAAPCDRCIALVDRPSY